MQTFYMPLVFCVKCNKNASVMRRMKGSKRWVEASCHGQTLNCEFVAEPNQEIRWEQTNGS